MGRDTPGKDTTVRSYCIGVLSVGLGWGGGGAGWRAAFSFGELWIVTLTPSAVLSGTLATLNFTGNQTCSSRDRGTH